MNKKILIPLIIIGMVFLVECKKDQSEIDQMSPAYNSDLKQGGNGGGKGGPGGGGPGGGGPGGAGGSGGLYGDLVICLRDVEGIPVYQALEGEHGLFHYPQPIMVHYATGELRTDENGDYMVFELNEEGEVIDDLTDEWIVKEVEFGRLNVVRAPQSVLDAALMEAFNAMNDVSVDWITQDASGRLIGIKGNEDWLVNYDEDPGNDEFDDKTIDAPRENVAIYQELLNTRGVGSSFWNLISDKWGGPVGPDLHKIALGALAAGADKTGNMMVDELGYMNDWLLDWDIAKKSPNSPDPRNRNYYDFSVFTNYNRETEYGNKYVRITILHGDGTWEYLYQTILDVVNWTDPILLPQYGSSGDNVTGFSNAVDDAIQVLEFLHSSDLYVYSPYFPPNEP